jgi:hypothetical protein
MKKIREDKLETINGGSWLSALACGVGVGLLLTGVGSGAGAVVVVTACGNMIAD